MPGTGVDTVCRAFVAAGAAELVRLGLQQRVERLLDRPPYHLVQVTADLALVNPDHLTQRLRAIFFHGGLHWSVAVASQLQF